MLAPRRRARSVCRGAGAARTQRRFSGRRVQRALRIERWSASQQAADAGSESGGMQVIGMQRDSPSASPWYIRAPPSCPKNRPGAPSIDQDRALSCRLLVERAKPDRAPRPAAPRLCPGTRRLLPSPSMDRRLFSHSSATRQGAGFIGL